MEQVHYFDPGVLLVKLLVLGPPFPGDAVREFGDFLGHRAAVVQQPFRLILFAHAFGSDADALVQRLLHPEQLAKLVGAFHAQNI